MSRQNETERELVSWGTAPSPFGRVVLASTVKGVCLLSFGKAITAELNWIKKKSPGCLLFKDMKKAAGLSKKIFNPCLKKGEIKTDLRGTEFQKKVWKTLLNIPFGETVSYEQVAIAAGNRKAARAAAGAVANNPVAYLVPCHRVIKKNGELHNYGGGKKRKEQMILWEQLTLGNNPAKNLYNQS